jgi:hypothetical protein
LPLCDCPTRKCLNRSKCGCTKFAPINQLKHVNRQLYKETFAFELTVGNTLKLHRNPKKSRGKKNLAITKTWNFVSKIDKVAKKAKHEKNGKINWKCHIFLADCGLAAMVSAYRHGTWDIMDDYGGAKDLWMNFFGWVDANKGVTIDVEIPWIQSVSGCLADSNALIALARKKMVDVPLTGTVLH